MNQNQDLRIGKVYLIGAGPGDPGMLTLRGQECLGKADVVLYDYLVNPDLLTHAKQAEQICLGKHGTGRLWPQAEINEKIVAEALQGKTVVRLKGGDTAIFARTHEELEAIKSRGIPFEIVPGITSALAVTGTVGIPLTHRTSSSAVAFVTGQGRAGGPPKNINYQTLARFPGTLVFYMATTTIRHWTAELLKNGCPPETPVVAVRHCSLPQQTSFQARLDTIADLVDRPDGRIRPPVLFVVGQTAAEYGRYNWFEERPLFGKTILVTRPRHQLEKLSAPLVELGATVLHQAAIEIEPINVFAEDPDRLTKLSQFDWIVFSSINGVRSLLDGLMERADVRKLSQAKLAAIGPATAAELNRYSLKADLVPETYEAESLAKDLVDSVHGQKVLLIRASRGREVLHEKLTAAGAQVEQWVCYESRDVTTPDPEIAEQLNSGKIDYVTVTSSAIARSLYGIFGDALQKATLASISPITTNTLNESGLKSAAEASQYTMPGIVDAIVRHAGAQ